MRLTPILLAGALGACTNPRDAAPPAPAPGQPAEAVAASARTPWIKARNPEDVALLEAPAVVLATPESNAGVSPPFRARIVKVNVKPGARVRRGDPVAEVVMPEVVQAAGTYASAATRAAAYARRAAQLEALKKDGMVRLTEVLEVETRLAEARADQQGALAMLRVAALGADDAQRILAGSGQVALRSPIDGVVTQVKAAIGENREAAGEPLVRVAGEGEPRVEARCARVLPDEAHFELWLASGERYPVKLVGRAPQVDPRDGTILAWFAPYPGTRLTQGQTGKVRIRLEEGRKLVAVPARAVALGAEGPYLVANRAGKAERARVEVIAASGADALVQGGVDIGDEIAADAALAAGDAAVEYGHPPPEEEEAEARRGAERAREREPGQAGRPAKEKAR